MAGDLQAAAELYLKAELPAEAARVLLLSADAVADPERRIVICAQAARVGEGTEVGQQARRRKALLSYDLAVSAPGATMHGELLTVAGELEACDEWEKAAQAYSLAGDEEAELRVLREAGAIERLESRLHEEAESRRFERDRRQLLRKITDLDSFAERREALRLADQWLETHTDEQVQHELVKIRGRLLSGPLLTLQVEGSTQRFALGSEVTLGRSGATITVHSRAVSRQHLRLFRQDGEFFVEDLETRNGTCLAGARISGALPVREGLALQLAGQIDCNIEPRDPGLPKAALTVEVAGERYCVALGPAWILDGWQVIDAHEGADRFVVLHAAEPFEPPYLNGYRLAREIQLCWGDELTRTRQGPVVVRVPMSSESRL